MKLTQRDIAPSLGYQDLVHVVLVNDLTQDTYGSSYKSTIQQIIDLAPKDSYVTGGTHNLNGGVTTFTNSTGTTFDVTGYFKPSDDIFVTGGTYNNLTGTATFQNNKDGIFTVDGFFTEADDTYVTGVTFNPTYYNLIISRNDGVDFSTDLSILSNDVKVTGGTYNPVDGVGTFTNNTGGTFTVTGFMTGYTDVRTTGGTYNPSNGIATYTNTLNETYNVSGFFKPSDDIFVTGGTYNPSSGIATFTNRAGNTFNVSGFNTPTENLQKEITTDYTVSSADNNYTILINNGTNPVTITVPTGLMSKINVGFIQQGTGEVNFLASSTTINSPLNMLKIKGQNYWAYLEQVTNTNVYHLVGSLKV